MSMFPDMAARMFTPIHVIHCSTVNVKGQVQKVEIEEADVVYVAFSNFQGTEKQVDGVLNIINTASICMPFRVNLLTGDKIKLLDSGEVYDIINSPENWNMQNLLLLFKVEKTKGGV